MCNMGTYIVGYMDTKIMNLWEPRGVNKLKPISRNIGTHKYNMGTYMFDFMGTIIKNE